MPVVREERPVEIFEDDLSDGELSEITVRAESFAASRVSKIMIDSCLDSCLDKPVAEHCTYTAFDLPAVKVAKVT